MIGLMIGSAFAQVAAAQNPSKGKPSEGGSGGYIFNLRTKGLKSGRYSLSIAVGGETAFVYNVTFEVK